MPSLSKCAGTNDFKGNWSILKSTNPMASQNIDYDQAVLMQSIWLTQLHL